MNIEGLSWIELVAIAGAVSAVLMIVLACLNPGKVRALYLAIGLLCLLPVVLYVAVFHPEIYDSRIRAFKNSFHAISIGMSPEQVKKSVSDTYSTLPSSPPPTLIDDSPGRIAYRMDPGNSGHPNAEIYIILLDESGVVGKNYSRD